MNSRDKGELAEGVILALLLRKGFIVSLPFGGAHRYDIIVEDRNGNGKLLKVQCKTGRLRKGAVTFNSCSTNGFTGKSDDYHGDADVFAVYCPGNEEVYWVPVAVVGRRKGKLRIDDTKNSQSKGIVWAKDFRM